MSANNLLLLRVRPRASVMVRAFPAGLMAVDGESGRYWELNETAAHLWQSIAKGGGTVADVLNELVDRYDGDRDKVASDLLSVVQQLLDDGALVLNPTSSVAPP